jgi:hypothetical protein
MPGQRLIDFAEDFARLMVMDFVVAVASAVDDPMDTQPSARRIGAYSPLLVRTASPLFSPPSHPPLGLIPSVSEPAQVEEEGSVGEATRRPPLHRVW